VTLSYRQGRLLRRAERALCRSDPDLASMLSIFARLSAAEMMPAREQLRPRPRLTWARRVLLWPAAAAAFLVGFAAGGRSSAATARGAASRRRARENRETR
jgi:hypothetical protein